MAGSVIRPGWNLLTACHAERLFARHLSHDQPCCLCVTETSHCVRHDTTCRRVMPTPLNCTGQVSAVCDAASLPQSAALPVRDRDTALHAVDASVSHCVRNDTSRDFGDTLLQRRHVCAAIETAPGKAMQRALMCQQVRGLHALDPTPCRLIRLGKTLRGVGRLVIAR